MLVPYHCNLAEAHIMLAW